MKSNKMCDSNCSDTIIGGIKYTLVIKSIRSSYRMDDILQPLR